MCTEPLLSYTLILTVSFCEQMFVFCLFCHSVLLGVCIHGCVHTWKHTSGCHIRRNPHLKRKTPTGKATMTISVTHTPTPSSCSNFKNKKTVKCSQWRKSPNASNVYSSVHTVSRVWLWNIYFISVSGEWDNSPPVWGHSCMSPFGL